MAAQQQGNFLQCPGSAAGEHVNGILHFQGIAHMGAQGLLHAGDNGHHRLVRQGADVHHGLGQVNAALQRVHNGTAASLHIQHNGICAAGQLLAHNRGGNQGQGIHGGGHVPKGVQGLVRRGKGTRLPDDGTANGLHLTDEGILGDFHAHAGDGFQLIQRAAGMSQSPAAHLGHGNAAGCYQWSQHQGGGIAYAAGGVLIHLHPRNGGKIRHVPGAGHAQGQVGGFFRCHAVEADGHQHGGKLIIGNGALCRPLHKSINFFVGQHLPQFLLADNLHHVHKRLLLRVSIFQADVLGRWAFTHAATSA